MRLLLDTHAFLWFLLNDPQLSSKAIALIGDPANDIEISPASYWANCPQDCPGQVQPA